MTAYRLVKTGRASIPTLESLRLQADEELKKVYKGLGPWEKTRIARHESRPHYHGRSVVVMGHEKGVDTESRLHHNFGMANPEGYRKAVRLMELAERFSLPVISFVDTAGAFPRIV